MLRVIRSKVRDSMSEKERWDKHFMKTLKLSYTFTINYFWMKREDSVRIELRVIFFKSTKKLVTNIYPEYNSKHIKSEEQKSYSNLKKELNFKQFLHFFIYICQCYKRNQKFGLTHRTLLVYSLSSWHSENLLFSKKNLSQVMKSEQCYMSD